MFRTDLARLAALVVLFAVPACQGDSESSDVDMVATDIDASGKAGETKYLFWVDGDVVTRGECIYPGFPTVSKCSHDKVQMGYDLFKTKLDNGLSATIVDIEGQVVQLRDLLTQIASDIVLIEREIEAREAAKSATTLELADMRAELHRLKTWSSELSEQLRLMAIALRKNPTSDLAEVAPVVASELKDIRVRMGEISKEMPELVARIGFHTAQIKMLMQDRVSLTASFEHFSKELDATLVELAQARSDFDRYLAAVSSLESGVITPVTQQFDGLFGSVKPFVRRFNAIFDQASK